jgi:hypothetical protein
MKNKIENIILETFDGRDITIEDLQEQNKNKIMKNKIMTLTKKQNDLQNDLLKLLTPGKNIMITTLFEDLPEIKGEFGICMPMKKGMNQNILWINKVSKDFVTVFNNLLNKAELITWNPESIVTFFYLKAPCYDVEQITIPKHFYTQKQYWLPISIKINLKINKPAKKIQLRKQ